MLNLFKKKGGSLTETVSSFLSETVKGAKVYTSVTRFDFLDEEYIFALKNLGVGFELALLTPIAEQLHFEKDRQRDFFELKKEIEIFKNFFDKFEIPIKDVRIHQPGGYMYYWFQESQYQALKDFVNFCSDLGFTDYVLHTPFGLNKVDFTEELIDFRKKLGTLAFNAKIEVEEIIASNKDLKSSEGLRFYNGQNMEKLLEGVNVCALLDVHECDGVDNTIMRLCDLKEKGFRLDSIHLQKDKHKVLTNEELKKLLTSNFVGNVINEGFILNDASFEEFCKTKSNKLMIPNPQRIKIMQNYSEIVKQINKTVIMLLGLPGSGKGTQAKLLSKKLSLPHVSVGDIIRREAKYDLELAKLRNKVMDEGKLLPDEIVFSVIRKHVEKKEYERGFILDGFPRTIQQANETEKLLFELQPTNVKIFFLDVSEEKIKERLVHRETCSGCCSTFNSKFAPPKIPKACDHCNNKLIRRGDDNEDYIPIRLSIYKEKTEPIINMYEEQKKLIKVDSKGDIDEVNDMFLRYIFNIPNVNVTKEKELNSKKIIDPIGL